MKCCKARWANWAKANWANSLLHCVFDTNNAFLTLVPARQSALRDFFCPSDISGDGKQKISGKFGGFKEKE